MRIGVTNTIKRSCPSKSVQIYRKCDFNPLTTIHDGNFRRHSSMYVTIHDGNFRRIYYSYTRIRGSRYALWPGSEEVKNDIYFVMIINGSFNKTMNFMWEKVKLFSLLARKDITEHGMINNPTNQSLETFINATFNDSPKIQP